MPLGVTNNLKSLNAQRHLNRTQIGLTKALERLSSGLRVNRAADDAAGLAISEKLRSNIRALAQARRNASDGIALIQVAEGAMDELNNMLTRMKELSEQAATGTVSAAERVYLQQEFDMLVAEIDRISESTRFNETNLLDGSLAINIQIGISNGPADSIAISITNVSSTSLGITGTINTATNAAAMLNTINTAIQNIAARRANMGALQNRLESITSHIDTVVENLTGAESRIRDADVAQETANLTKYTILQQAGVAVLSQANQEPQVALRLLQG